MKYILFVYSRRSLYELDMSGRESATLGSANTDTLVLEGAGLLPGHLRFSIGPRGLHMMAKKPVRLKDQRTEDCYLTAGDLVLVEAAEQLSITLFEKRCDYHKDLLLSGQAQFGLGRSVENDICLKSPHVSGRHALLRRQEGRWVLKDQSSRNGTFVNGGSIQSATLKEGDEIFMGGWKLRYQGDSLRFLNTLGGLQLASGLSSGAASEEISEEGPRLMEKPEKPYPYFSLSPRLLPELPSAELEILSPPHVGTKPQISWMGVILPPILTITVMLAIATFTGNQSMLYFTVPMTLIGIVIAYANYSGQVKRYKANESLATQKYAEHLKEKESFILSQQNKLLQSLNGMNPSAAECMGIAAKLSRRLWERTVWDEDFLSLRLGAGSMASNVSIKIPRTQILLEEDNLSKQADRLKQKYELIQGAPITHSFLNLPTVGLTGSRPAIHKMAWTILMGIATHHS